MLLCCFLKIRCQKGATTSKSTVSFSFKPESMNKKQTPQRFSGIISLQYISSVGRSPTRQSSVRYHLELDSEFDGERLKRNQNQ